MLKYKNTNLNIILDDITNQSTDAIVNAANNTLLGGSGVDGAIHKKGGHSILEQCIKHGGCPTGEARITTAGDLPCKYVIHTVGPIYDKSNNRERHLYNAYYNSLKLAVEYNLNSISFPSISTGAYGYPIDEAIDLVFNAIKNFIDEIGQLKYINLVLFNEDDYSTYREYFDNMLNK